MASHLAVSELLQIELPGKKVAMGRYDQILWRIRSGYLVVLAGTLGFFTTEGSEFRLTNEVVAIIVWFSFVAWMVDIAFRRRQLRVTRAYNELVSAAIKNLPEHDGLGHIKLELFHISGERLATSTESADISIAQCLFPSAIIYGGTTLVTFVLLVLSG